MNKVIPFIFPAIAFLIVIFLAFRWIKMSSSPRGDINSTGENVSIETLTDSQRDQILRGVGDYRTVTLTGEAESMGSVRYEVKDGKVTFSVTANLPELETGHYQVWVKSGMRQTKAFKLEVGKAGYMGSAAFNQTDLPAEIIISWETQDDTTLEKVVLSGTVKE